MEMEGKGGGKRDRGADRPPRVCHGWRVERGPYESGAHSGRTARPPSRAGPVGSSLDVMGMEGIRNEYPFSCDQSNTAEKTLYSPVDGGGGDNAYVVFLSLVEGAILASLRGGGAGDDELQLCIESARRRGLASDKESRSRRAAGGGPTQSRKQAPYEIFLAGKPTEMGPDQIGEIIVLQSDEHGDCHVAPPLADPPVSLGGIGKSDASPEDLHKNYSTPEVYNSYSIPPSLQPTSLATKGAKPTLHLGQTRPSLFPPPPLFSALVSERHSNRYGMVFVLLLHRSYETRTTNRWTWEEVSTRV
uniref:Uncharacterized protein n=1 Tax=Oryza nivara TaxID=4536 RepID=A0A0E0G9X0_ORYNI